MKKVLIHALLTGLFGLVLMMTGLCLWLFNPLDQHAWRVQLHVPGVGVMYVRAYPLLQLATSSPGRRYLDGSIWQSSHGRIILKNEAGAVRVSCEKCTISIAELSPKPVQLDNVSLTVRNNQRQLSGLLEVRSAQHDIKLLYVGHIDMQGVHLKWTLPQTELTTLLGPLQGHSHVLQIAHVNGTLAATGTLQWPSRTWSATPELQDFEVRGLGTEKLKYGALKYRCHGAKQDSTSNGLQSYAWLTEKRMGRWLPKAVLIAEDAKFMQHPGYDMDTLRYLLGTENRDKQSGGSTITQQLAKNFFTGGGRNWMRKLEELLYAVEMEQTLGKQRIMALYLNTVDWGPGICGASQAANVYFGRTPSRLNPMQAAWLAGIIRNPHRAWKQEYQLQNPDMERVNWVLSYMPKKVRRQPLSLQFSLPQSLANQQPTLE